MSTTVGHGAGRATLPYVVTPVLGRDREAARLRDLLADADHRLVTVLGPGGVGKTRLAIHVASAAAEAGREVLFVAVASLRDPGLVLQAIGHAAGASGEAPEDALPWLVEAAQGRELLLVLDNLEQVLGVAPLLGQVLEGCPDLTILATSRAALDIRGEHGFPLAPLSVPVAGATDPGEILRTDAAALFMDRARSRHRHFDPDSAEVATIAAICRTLDGLPLAIELAAARTNILPPRTLLERISESMQVLGASHPDLPGLPVRQRTMRRAIAWSYDLLGVQEQALFRWLAVFEGGASLEAVRSVPGEWEDAAEGVLAALVDHSLVKAVAGMDGGARFLLLETVRMFGLEQLAAHGEVDRAHLAHALYYTMLCEAAGTHMSRETQATWMQRIEEELDNCRAAIGWALGHGREDLVLRIVSSIWWCLCGIGAVTEGRAWLDRALAASAPSVMELRPMALVASGLLASEQDDIPGATDAFARALHLSIALGDAEHQMQAIHGLGKTAYQTGDYPRALDLFREARDLARRIGNARCVARGETSCGIVLHQQGETDAAITHWEAALAFYAASGEVVTESIVSCNLGMVAHDAGDFERARALYLRAIDIQRQQRSWRDLPVPLVAYGEIARYLGEFEEGRVALREAIDLIGKEHKDVTLLAALNALALLDLASGDDARAAVAILEMTELEPGPNETYAVLVMSHSVAELCAHRAGFGEAVEFLAAEDALREDVSLPLCAEDRRERAALLTKLRAELGDDRFASHWSAGNALGLADVRHRANVLARALVGNQQPSPVLAAPWPAAPDPVPHELTAREIEVLRHAAAGMTNRDISMELSISQRTTAAHMSNVLAKLEVPSRTAAVAWAMRAGIV